MIVVLNKDNLVIFLRIKHLALYNLPQFSTCKIKGFHYNCLVLDQYNILLDTGKEVPFDKNKKTNDYNVLINLICSFFELKPIFL